MRSFSRWSAQTTMKPPSAKRAIAGRTSGSTSALLDLSFPGPTAYLHRRCEALSCGAAPGNCSIHATAKPKPVSITVGSCRFVPGRLRKVDIELAAARRPVHAEQTALDVLGARVPPDGDELRALKAGNAGLILIARGCRIDRKFVSIASPAGGEPSVAQPEGKRDARSARGPRLIVQAGEMRLDVIRVEGRSREGADAVGRFAGGRAPRPCRSPHRRGRGGIPPLRSASISRESGAWPQRTICA